MESKPIRKKTRLDGIDYSLPGRYFVTFCTKNRKEILGTIPYADNFENGNITLSKSGEAVKAAILSISSAYPTVSVDRYSIMPDHVHLLLHLKDGSPKLSVIIGHTKRKASISSGESLWQMGFFDHIIRNENDFQETIQYIDNNVKRRMLNRIKNK